MLLVICIGSICANHMVYYLVHSERLHDVQLLITALSVVVTHACNIALTYH